MEVIAKSEEAFCNPGCSRLGNPVQNVLEMADLEQMLGKKLAHLPSQSDKER